jgi:hypothetical protein
VLARIALLTPSLVRWPLPRLCGRALQVTPSRLLPQREREREQIATSRTLPNALHGRGAIHREVAGRLVSGRSGPALAAEQSRGYHASLQHEQGNPAVFRQGRNYRPPFKLTTSCWRQTPRSSGQIAGLNLVGAQRSQWTQAECGGRVTSLPSVMSLNYVEITSAAANASLARRIFSRILRPDARQTYFFGSWLRSAR